MAAALCQFCGYSFYHCIWYLLVNTSQSGFVAHFGTSLYPVAYPGYEPYHGATHHLYARLFHHHTAGAPAQEFRSQAIHPDSGLLSLRFLYRPDHVDDRVSANSLRPQSTYRLSPAIHRTAHRWSRTGLRYRL